MEIKIGEYVRTKKGLIRKVTNVINDVIEIDKEYYDEEDEYSDIRCYDFFIENVIAKHGSIIDLIEVGDIVNKQEVVNVEGFDKNGNDKEALGIIEINGDDAYGVFLEDIPIKTIVTHEQLEEMEYKV